jgi:hypothetical protein
METSIDCLTIFRRLTLYSLEKLVEWKLDQTERLEDGDRLSIH